MKIIMQNAHWRLVSVAALSLALLTGAGCSRQARKARHLKRADRYYQSSQYDQAEIEYMNVVRLDGRSVPALRRLGFIYHDQGRAPQAFMLLRKAEELDPADLEVRLALGWTYLAVRQFEEARSEARHILKEKPRYGEALLLLADTAKTAEEIEQVRQFLQGLREQAGNEAEFEVALGSLAFREKDFSGAEKALRRALERNPNSSAAHAALGNLYWAQNDLKKAEEALQKAAELAPVRSGRRVQLADFKIKTGDVDAGKRNLERVTSEAPDYLPAWLRLAEVAYAQKKFDDCERLTKKVLARDAMNFDGLMLSGRLRLAQREGEKAVADFERLAKIYPHVPLVQYQLALAQLLNRDMAKAMTGLSQVVAMDSDLSSAVLLLAELNIRKGDLAPAIKLLTSLIERRPEIKEAQLLLATAYRAQGELNEALATYDRMNEQLPRNPEPRLLMGLLLLQQGKGTEARQAFEKALEIAPGYLPALEQLVDLDLGEKQFDVALKRITKYVEKAPKAPVLQLFLAKIFMAQREPDQAEAALLKAIELDPAFRSAHLLLAQLYVGANKHQQALDRLEQVTARNANDLAALMQIGMINDQKKDFAAAKRAYEKVLSINPEFSPALNNLAYLYSERFGQLEQAYELARKARDLVPKDPYTADTLGWILYKRGEYGWSLNLLQESAEKLPTSPDVFYHLGMTHYMMGEETAARVALERAVESKKEFVGRDEAQKRLALLKLDVKTAGPETIADLEKQLDQQPDEPVTLARLGAIYERDGAFKKAAEMYERLLKQNPKNVTATIKLARLNSERLNNSSKALELARSARSLAPEDPLVSHILGRLAFSEGDHKWALSLLQESARKLQSDPEVLHDLAWADYSMGLLSEAESTMQSALRAAADFPDIDSAREFVEMAALYRDAERALQSESRVQDKLKSAPDYVPALLVAASSYERRGDAAAARQSYEKILRRYPHFGVACKRLATLCSDGLGDYAAAYDYATRAREGLPDDPDVAKTLGIVVYRRGDYSRSAELLAESARKLRSDADLHFYLAMARFKLKQESESQDALRQALALNESSKLADEARQVLAGLK